MLVGDGRVDPIPEPGLRPFPVPGHRTQKVGVQHTKINRQAAGRVVAAAPALIGDERGVAPAGQARADPLGRDAQLGHQVDGQVIHQVGVAMTRVVAV